MKGKVFAQLYSIVRQERDGHLEALKHFSEFGYDGVELLGNNTNGLTLQEYRQLLKDLNLKAISSHNLHTEEDFEFAAGLGLKYAVLGGCDAVRDEEKLKKICDDWNETGRKLKEYGLKGVIHNHGEEFCLMNGELKEKRIYDYIADNTDPESIGFELDVGWVVRAGLDPVEYINRYPGRFPLIHMKECAYAAVDFEDLEHFPSRVLKMGPPKIVNGVPYFSEEQKEILNNSRKWNTSLGKGIVDFEGIVKAAEAQGCEAYVNEREYYLLPEVPDGDPVRCAELDSEWLHALAEKLG